jgi:hypothetical protein
MLKFSSLASRKLAQLWSASGRQGVRSIMSPLVFSHHASTYQFPFNITANIKTNFKNCWAVPSRSFHTSFVRLEESKIVVVPPFADSISEGDVRWEKAVGDQVSIDETVAEVETDKVISQNNLKIVSKPL